MSKPTRRSPGRHVCILDTDDSDFLLHIEAFVYYFLFFFVNMSLFARIETLFDTLLRKIQVK